MTFHPRHTIALAALLAASSLLGVACDDAGSCETDGDCFAGEFCYQGTCAPTSVRDDAGQDATTRDTEDNSDTSSADTTDTTTSDSSNDTSEDTTTDTRDDDTGTNPSIEIASIAAGGLHTCAALESGEVLCWGNNGEGELGNGDENTNVEETPVYVANMTDAASIAGGHLHSCAVRDDDTLWCWGSNSSLQITGDDTTSAYYYPESAGLSDVVEVDAGESHNCARTLGGDIFCIGGAGASDNGTNVPPGMGDVSDISTGYRHSCAVSLGSVYCWGSDSSDQLGDNRPVSGITNAVEVAAGRDHTCARLNNGQVKCWGSNDKGQLGDAEAPSSGTPVTVANLTNVTDIAAGFNHTCVVYDGGTVACWGEDGEAVNSGEPKIVFGLQSGMTQVTAGSYHSCALQAAGGVVCWGLNSYGQLGDGSQTSRDRPVLVDFE